MKIGGIYKILNLINNKCYIGSTKDFIKRKSYHFIFLKNGNHPNQYLQRAVNKYGIENFIFIRIEIITDESLLFSREQYYADITSNLYNLREIVESNRGMKFLPLTTTHKQAISIGNTGKVRSEETKKIIKQNS